MPNIPQQALLELAELYRLAEQELSPYTRRCAGRGTCCHFDERDHMLYVTTLEAAAMSRAGLPADATQAKAGRCPFQRDHACGIYHARALGCRLYYCDHTYSEERNALYEKYLRLIRHIEDKYKLACTYTPLTSVNFQE